MHPFGRLPSLMLVGVHSYYIQDLYYESHDEINISLFFTTNNDKKNIQGAASSLPFSYGNCLPHPVYIVNMEVTFLSL
jgi:hypothetical protein